MRKPKHELAWWVVYMKGQLILHDSEGNEVPCQIKMRVDENVNEDTFATVSMHVNLAGSVDEMREQIKQWKEE